MKIIENIKIIKAIIDLEKSFDAQAEKLEKNLSVNGKALKELRFNK